MKKFAYALLFILSFTLVLTSCKDDEETTPEVKKVTLGAQSNTTSGGFYSVSENKVYTQDLAFQNQGVIDMFCFFEADKSANNIALAAPGSNITGIFTGETSVENYTTKDTTYFCATTLTVAQFDALAETDALIQSSFNADEKYRKAKDLKVDDIYAFMIQSGIYGVLKVTAVTQGATGSVTFEVKIKK